MKKLARSYFLSILLTTLMCSMVCAQELPGVEKPGEGDTFPRFQLTDTAHRDVDLHDFFHEQPVLLIYYRGGW